MLRLLLLVVFVASSCASEDLGTAQLTNEYLRMDHTHKVFSNINRLLDNPAMKTFYQEYYSRPQLTQEKQIDDLLSRLRDMKSSAVSHGYPYANQVSVDPNVVRQLVATTPRQYLTTNINKLNQQNQRLDESNKMNKETYLKQYNNRNAKTNDIRAKISKVDDRLFQSGLLNTQAHDYSRPFRKGANMDNLLKTIRSMEHSVKAPLSPAMPNVEEINAINRLSEKLDRISRRLHQRPTEALHQDAHAQDLQLEQAANLIRRMSNSVESTHRDPFLQTLHQLLHKHHLHDHKFASSLENEIAFAIANGTPLQMPRVYGNDASISANPSTQFNLKTAVTAPTGTTAPTTTATTTGATQQQQNQQLGNVEQAKVVADQMKRYGQDIISRSKEMNHRADIAERRIAVPEPQRQALKDHIEHRLVSPPAQVHTIGSARPL